MNEKLSKGQIKTFAEALNVIRRSRLRALQNVNRELIDLYWHFGKLVSEKTDNDGWGKGTVKALATYIKEQEPEIKGFNERNIWRMRQFFDTYGDNKELVELVKELSWTNNLIVLSRCKTHEEREFYLQKSVSERYSSRELEKQITHSLFERRLQDNSKLSAVLTDLYPIASNIFKDNYIFDFLDLSADHSEKELQDGLVCQLKEFILELGKDFAYVGEEYRLQVGAQDFFVDLLFFHRDLQCLVAIELKVDKFRPEFMGQMEFYLEALDRDVKKEHEKPSIGILLCKDKDEDVVEYAMSRSLSPALVAQYETKLIPRDVLRRKLQELTQFDEDGFVREN